MVMPGQNSVFNGHTANGGGYGGWYSGSWNQGTDGGSGGGGMNTQWGTGEVYGHPSPEHGWATKHYPKSISNSGFDLMDMVVMVDTPLHLYHQTQMLWLMVVVAVLVDLEDLEHRQIIIPSPIEEMVAAVLEDNSHNSLVN